MFPFSSRLAISIAAFALGCTASPKVFAQVPTSYTITNLGYLGGSSSFANSVNNLGQVTGNSQLAASQPAPRLNAYLWSNGTMQNLGVVPGSNNFSRGYSINDNGHVVGDSDNNAAKAFYYTPSSGMTQLNGLGPNNTGAAYGINNSNIVVGSSSNGSAVRPVIWSNPGSSTSQPRDIGTLDGATNTSGMAYAVNNNGLVVGRSATSVVVGSDRIGHAFSFFDANGNGITDAGELVDLDANTPGAATRFSEAVAVNNNGMVAGRASTGQSTGSGTPIIRPAVWQNGTRTDLGTTLGSTTYTFGAAVNVNDTGAVVGNVTNISGSPQVAFLWTAMTGMVDLNTLLPTGSGWTLRAAQDINNSGQIVGYGTFNGNTTAFLLTPVTVPEAGSLVLAIPTLGLIGLGLTRRLHKQRSDV